MDLGLPSTPVAPPAGTRRTRDRRGRGMRGPGVLPQHLGRPHGRTDRERFDQLVLEMVGALEDRWDRHLGLVEYAVEDAPVLPDDWGEEHVPLSSLVRGKGAEPTRLVLFRRPIEHRSGSRLELEVLVHTVLVQQVAELLGLPPETVDPGYRPED